MIDITLKGINRVAKKLASGKVKYYYYHRATGKPLHGTPGSPDFLRAYAEAQEKIKSTNRNIGTFKEIIQRYQESPKYQEIAPRTRRDYQRQIVKIEEAFGDMPIEALEDKRVRGDFLDWRDKLARSSRKQADYAITVLGVILSWSVDRGIISQNYAARPGKLYRSERAEIIWTDDAIEAFLVVASPELQLALILARDTGQRQGDLLRLTWSSYDGQYIRLKQSKTGARVEVPVTRELRSALEKVKAVRMTKGLEATTILTRPDGQPWKVDHFRHEWIAATKEAKLKNLHFNDLRGTAVTALADASCTPIEIASITGHSLKSVSSILEHYLARTRTQADGAIVKLENARSTKTANHAANRGKKG